MKRRLSSALAVGGAALVFGSPAVAAPPVLTSVTHTNRHPAATWTLPQGVKAQVAEVATSPATSTDGYFFSENVKAFDLLEDAQTNWVYNSQLDPGVYYVHIAGLDEPCFYAGLCPVREFTQIATLVIAAAPPPPPPPPPRPRYEASVRSIHPGAIGDGSRNWTYLGDTVRVSPLRRVQLASRPADRRPKTHLGLRVTPIDQPRLSWANRAARSTRREDDQHDRQRSAPFDERLKPLSAGGEGQWAGPTPSAR